MLVVEDNADMRLYVCGILERTYRTLHAEDGQQGLETALDALPDLIVADVMMPRLDGFALSRALHEDPRTDSIPLILLTARATTSDEVEGIRTTLPFYLRVMNNAWFRRGEVYTNFVRRRMES